MYYVSEFQPILDITSYGDIESKVRHVWCERHHSNAQVQHFVLSLSCRCIVLLWCENTITCSPIRTWLFAMLNRYSWFLLHCVCPRIFKYNIMNMVQGKSHLLYCSSHTKVTKNARQKADEQHRASQYVMLLLKYHVIMWNLLRIVNCDVA